LLISYMLTSESAVRLRTCIVIGRPFASRVPRGAADRMRPVSYSRNWVMAL
jgi:hypothetical protein